MDSFAVPLSDAANLAVQNYIKWQIQFQTADFMPKADDDIDLRTYLFRLYIKGADSESVDEQVAALKLFYQLAQSEGDITHNPFDGHNFIFPFHTNK